MPEWTHQGGLQLAFACLLFAASMMRGAKPERFLAATLLVFLSIHLILAPTLAAIPARQAGATRVALDLLAFAAILVIALRANRFYPMALGAAQLAKWTCHLWHVGLTNPSHAAYVIISRAAFDIQLVMLAAGLVCHDMRERRLGHRYPDWSF